MSDEWIRNLEDAIEDLESDSWSEHQVKRNESLKELLNFMKELQNDVYYKSALEARNQDPVTRN